jgi:hypothetical protein
LHCADEALGLSCFTGDIGFGDTESSRSQELAEPFSLSGTLVPLSRFFIA